MLFFLLPQLVHLWGLCPAVREGGTQHSIPPGSFLVLSGPYKSSLDQIGLCTVSGTEDPKYP